MMKIFKYAFLLTVTILVVKFVINLAFGHLPMGFFGWEVLLFINQYIFIIVPVILAIVFYRKNIILKLSESFYLSVIAVVMMIVSALLIFLVTVSLSEAGSMAAAMQYIKAVTVMAFGFGQGGAASTATVIVRVISAFMIPVVTIFAIISIVPPVCRRVFKAK